MNRFGLLLTCLLLGCGRPGVSPAPRALIPAMLLGDFQDDYGSRHQITETSWRHGSRITYHVVKWDVAQRYLIAQNDSANPGQALRWTRIDWMELPGMPPYEWGFCLTNYDAPSAAAAEGTAPPVRGTPKTGCNGFPFSRMRRPSSPP